ncbi:toxin-antitoxin system YwqK family antitoxin [Winogradskyella aquimaris]|uniref:Nicotinic acid mononucleotide adenyltransferase n=1 Tax=Winogradskyella aquimaris TaxID=864074 RepID=A0ABU5EMQ1_9FLAO|nr:nicotinic acid mononucleotide adenyltransferase [Winogradskyella aquimaris]MDY2585947.1 nicotinic acid mononucleotide adenyltransferase [Winogradskyella aquimaris]
MNKKILILFAYFFSLFAFAQQERDLKLNKDTNLIEVTYYHENGEVSQTGFYNLDGKLHGEWLTFDDKGKKSISAKYDNGKKVGKWFYWSGNSLKEVDYNNNIVANVNEWTSTDSKLASNN